MFREMRRFKQQVSDDVCREILRTEGRGVLSVIGDDGYPYGVPLDFSYDEEDNCIYFHAAKVGHKIDAIKACDKACFTVLGKEFKNEGEWFYRVNSVIVFGKAELVEDAELTASKTRILAEKYYPTPEDINEEMEADIHKVQLIALHIEHMTGKAVTEK